MKTITPQEAQEAAAAGAALIDVRTPGEFNAVHATGAQLLPLDTLKPEVARAEVERHRGKQLMLLCKGGKRASMAAAKLEAQGADVFVVEGGTDAWVAAGLPVQRGKGTISLDRQVRIAAGALVVLGVVLGNFYMTGLCAIAAFVGAGLIFAGLTDTCGMAMLLGKMPWNRGATCSRLAS